MTDTQQTIANAVEDAEEFELSVMDTQGQKPRLRIENWNPDHAVVALRDILSCAPGIFDRGVPVGSWLPDLSSEADRCTRGLIDRCRRAAELQNLADDYSVIVKLNRQPLKRVRPGKCYPVEQSRVYFQTMTEALLNPLAHLEPMKKPPVGGPAE
jgi:hypothetical protein